MKNRTCKLCNKIKALSCFFLHKATGYYENICKPCRYQKYKLKSKKWLMKNWRTAKAKYNKLHPWYTHYCALKQRCNYRKYHSYHRYGGRGIKCLISLNDLKEIWFRDKAYNLTRPSLDRINNNGHYSKDNIMFIEHNKNCSKQGKRYV